MKRSVFAKNKTLFIILSIIIILIILLFVYFIRFFNRFDNNRYDIEAGSIIYDDDFNYIKVEGDAYLDQQLDGNYYLIDEVDNKRQKYKIGNTAVVYHEGDYRLYLYGLAYQVLETGEVKTLKGQTEIAKTSPTKFYKLQDRKYLFVDSNIRTDDNSINTSDYLIIELDKNGNATFANQEMNIKTINPIVLKGSIFQFDIANEILIYNDEEINLKNIIGSTNQYQELPDQDEQEEGNDNTSNESNSGLNYYDQYFNNVINSFNNLTNSVNDINENTQNSVQKDEIYFDFSKWLALKEVSPGVTSININYTVFDPNSEYQAVFINVMDSNNENNKIYLNTNETSYTIRNLEPDSEYTLTFGYQLANDGLDVYEDTVVVKTKKPNYTLTVTKITSSAIYYTLTIDATYKFDSATVGVYMDGVRNIVDVIDTSKITSDNKYYGTINYTSLGYFNELKLEDIVYNGSIIELNVTSKFVN